MLCRSFVECSVMRPSNCSRNFDLVTSCPKRICPVPSKGYRGDCHGTQIIVYHSTVHGPNMTELKLANFWWAWNGLSSLSEPTVFGPHWVALACLKAWYGMIGPWKAWPNISIFSEMIWLVPCWYFTLTPDAAFIQYTKILKIAGAEADLYTACIQDKEV